MQQPDDSQGILPGVVALFFLPCYDDPQSHAERYGMAGVFDTLLSAIGWMTAVFGVITAALMMVSRRDMAGGTT